MPAPAGWPLLAALLAAAACAAWAQSPAEVAPVADAPTNRGLKPERWSMYKRMHYYQIPENPKGTLVTFHGCGRYSKAFFPWNPETCEECLGFPEHVSQTKQALAAGYAILALEPGDDRHLCWSSSSRGVAGSDQPRVMKMLEWWLTDHGLRDKPLLLLGVSSGGTLALKLAVELEKLREQAKEGEWVPRVAGVISEESVPTNFNAADKDGKLAYKNFPPTIFVVMELGNSRLAAPGVVKFLRDGGVPADFIVSWRRRVVSTFFSDRIPAITQQQSRWIVAGMQKIGMIDDEGWLLGDPERNRFVRRNTTSPAHKWEGKLKRLLPWLASDHPTLSLVYRQCGIQQALNVAYSRHDAVSDYLTVCIKWIESGGQADLATLMDEYTVPRFNLTALTIIGVEPPGDLTTQENEGGGTGTEQEGIEEEQDQEEEEQAGNGGTALVPEGAPAMGPAMAPAAASAMAPSEGLALTDSRPQVATRSGDCCTAGSTGFLTTCIVVLLASLLVLMQL